MYILKNAQTMIREVGVLALVAVALVGANYASGAWTNPTGTPPNGNVDTPITTGTATQIKNGDLILANTYPVLELLETDAQGSRLVNSNSALYMQFNRGTVAAPSWYSGLRLSSPDSSFGHATLSYGQMRAPEYCDVNGNNCSSSASINLSISGFGDFTSDYALNSAISYTAGATRTNSSVRPIYVYASDYDGDVSGNATLYLRAPGGSWTIIGRVMSTQYETSSFMVPPGYSYRITFAGGPARITELR